MLFYSQSSFIAISPFYPRFHNPQNTPSITNPTTAIGTSSVWAIARTTILWMVYAVVRGTTSTWPLPTVWVPESPVSKSASGPLEQVQWHILIIWLKRLNKLNTKKVEDSFKMFYYIFSLRLVCLINALLGWAVAQWKGCWSQGEISGSILH